MRVQVSNIHVDRLQWILRGVSGWRRLGPARQCRVVEQDEDQFGSAVVETDASPEEVAAAMNASAEVDDRCSAYVIDATTIAQPVPATDTMTVGTGDAEGLSAGLAEELAGMAPEDRTVAQRVSDLDEVEPRPGYEERTVERAKREGLL